MIEKFYKKTIAERRNLLTNEDFTETDMQTMAGDISQETAFLDKMSENVIGSFRLPLGVLTGIIVNGREHKVAMATEEPSVIAAANRAAKVFNLSGGVTVDVSEPVTLAQIFVYVHEDSDRAISRSLANQINLTSAKWINLANSMDPRLIQAGGGAFKLTAEPCYPKDSNLSAYIIITLFVKTADAMGANIVNTMAEKLHKEIVTEYCDRYPCERGFAIVTNAAFGRKVTARVDLPFDIFPQNIARRIAYASEVAATNKDRAVTHHKGIMNGIIAAALPLGQDTRAIEASFYDLASQRPETTYALSSWKLTQDHLAGQLTIELPVGFVGGSRANPAYNAAFKFDLIENYTDLCGILASVGIASNFAALWALTTDGIQAGHMKLHTRKL